MRSCIAASVDGLAEMPVDAAPLSPKALVDIRLAASKSFIVAAGTFLSTWVEPQVKVHQPAGELRAGQEVGLFHAVCVWLRSAAHPVQCAVIGHCNIGKVEAAVKNIVACMVKRE